MFVPLPPQWRSAMSRQSCWDSWSTQWGRHSWSNGWWCQGEQTAWSTVENTQAAGSAHVPTVQQMQRDLRKSKCTTCGSDSRTFKFGCRSCFEGKPYHDNKCERRPLILEASAAPAPPEPTPELPVTAAPPPELPVTAAPPPGTPVPAAPPPATPHAAAPAPIAGVIPGALPPAPGQPGDLASARHEIPDMPTRNPPRCNAEPAVGPLHQRAQPVTSKQGPPRPYYYNPVTFQSKAGPPPRHYVNSKGQYLGLESTNECKQYAQTAVSASNARTQAQPQYHAAFRVAAGVLIGSMKFSGCKHGGEKTNGGRHVGDIPDRSCGSFICHDERALLESWDTPPLDVRCIVKALTDAPNAVPIRMDIVQALQQLPCHWQDHGFALTYAEQWGKNAGLNCKEYGSNTTENIPKVVKHDGEWYTFGNDHTGSQIMNTWSFLWMLNNLQDEDMKLVVDGPSGQSGGIIKCFAYDARRRSSSPIAVAADEQLIWDFVLVRSDKSACWLHPNVNDITVEYGELTSMFERKVSFDDKKNTAGRQTS